MISLPLYCKSIKQINCFKRQTANILSSVPSNHSLKRQRRQVANVPKSFVRTSDEKWPSIAGGPVSKQSPPIVHLRSASTPARALGRIRRKCTDCNFEPQKCLATSGQRLRPGVKTAPSVCQSPRPISIFYLLSLQQNR